MTYTSDRPASDVAECIASGWRKSPGSGYEAPISLTKLDEYYFVASELRDAVLPYGGVAYMFLIGTKHPTYPVWAEVRDSPLGSTTEYHRAYQIMHSVIDRVVVECQGSRQ